MSKRDRIRSIVLYGSQARCDATLDSDVDVLVLNTFGIQASETEVRHLAPALPDGPLSIACYGEEQVEAMLQAGSLFLWHIRLEGVVLFGEEFLSDRLQSLAPFTNHKSDIQYHAKMFADMQVAVRDVGPIANECDLSILFSIARNTCMLLVHKKGRAVFSRNDCYDKALALYPHLPLARGTYSLLSHWKSVYERGVPCVAALPSRDTMTLIIAEIRELLEFACAATS